MFATLEGILLVCIHFLVSKPSASLCGSTPSYLPPCVYLAIIIRLGNEIIAPTLLGIPLNQVLIFLIYIPHPKHRRSLFNICGSLTLHATRQGSWSVALILTRVLAKSQSCFKVVKPKLRQKKVAEVKRIRKTRGLKQRERLWSLDQMTFRCWLMISRSWDHRIEACM